MFLQDKPIGPGDRVMAGLSVAFDASCEEMWLAWRHGACLVPAPRSLVRSGMDLGPWLLANDITVVSTVPTLVALWPASALDDVRLLILGGEACPPEIGARLATADREVWNTYGPTEATVVACGARLTGEPPVRIGLPLDGWDLAVVDPQGRRVADGETGELIIGGVGLARYLDPAKDADVYAAMPTLGWDRAYRSGDIVRFDGEGLVFRGRADDQVKVGGRRIELGEIDSALLALPGVSGAAAAVRRSEAGNSLLVGYVTTAARLRRPGLGRAAAGRDAGGPRARGWRSSTPSPPARRARSTATPCPGHRPRDRATRHPSRSSSSRAPQRGSPGTGQRSSAGRPRRGRRLLRPRRRQPDGGPARLAPAGTLPRGHRRRRVRRPRARRARRLARRDGDAVRPAERRGAPRPGHHPGRPAAGVARLPVHRRPALAHLGRRRSAGGPLAPRARLAAGRRLGLGRAGVAPPRQPARTGGPGRRRRATGARRRAAGAPTRGVGRCTCGSGSPSASSTSSAPPACRRRRWSRSTPGCWAPARRSRRPPQRPPVTGLLALGAAARSSPRSTSPVTGSTAATCTSGAVARRCRCAGRRAQHPPARCGRRRAGRGRAGVGGVRQGPRRRGVVGGSGRCSPGRPWTLGRGPPGEPPGLAARVCRVGGRALRSCRSWPSWPGWGWPSRRSGRRTGIRDAVATAARWVPVSTVVALVTLVALVLAAVRLLSLGPRGRSPPRPRTPGWQAWSILRVLDEARTWLFPLYSSALTPPGCAPSGQTSVRVEASTVLMIPPFVRVGPAPSSRTTPSSGATSSAGLAARRARRVGKGAFVGNSGMAAPGRRSPSGASSRCSPPRRGAATAKAGTSWLGSPPRPLGARPTIPTPPHLCPPTRLRVARAAGRGCRVVPCAASTCSSSSSSRRLLAALLDLGARWAVALGGLVLLAAGVLAGAVTVVAKWLLVGRLARLGTPAVELVRLAQRARRHLRRGGRGPWFARAATGTAVLNLWLRAMGSRIGRRSVVRDLLASRGRPHRPARRRDRRARVRRADPPVPRPDPVDGPGHGR